MPVDLVLLQPESPGNVGSVARVMKNFSFENLVLVNPCEINEETKGFAMHAWDIVKNAKILKEMDWDSYDFIAGTTGIDTKKNIIKSYVSPRELSDKMGNGRNAVIFGREGTGLSNEELERCDCICRIPTSDKYPIMNISHSVSVILYELSIFSTEYKKDSAVRGQIDVLQNLFKSVIKNLNYSQQKEKITYVCMKNAIGRSILSKKEASILIGMFKKIKECIK